jgi:hypothetical protein
MSLTQSVPLEPIAYARFLQIYRRVNLASPRGDAAEILDYLEAAHIRPYREVFLAWP